MSAAIDAALLQQWLWAEKEHILYNYLVKQLDYFGSLELEFGNPLF